MAHLSEGEEVGELLKKARSIIANEMDIEESNEKDEVSIREPPAVRSLLLTQSQEATFENVEKLQAQLEAVVEGEQDDETSKRQDKVDKDLKVKQMSPLRGTSLEKMPTTLHTCYCIDIMHGYINNKNIASTLFFYTVF